jgi:hypothetical protein
MAKEDMRRTMSRLWQWPHTGSSGELIDLVKKDDNFPQGRHRYS